MQQYLPIKVEKIHSTYAIVSEPLSHKSFWFKNALAWKTAATYIYIRTTKVNTLLIGGKDIPYKSGIAIGKQLKSEVSTLLNSLKSLFPSINFKKDFSWIGSFAGTKDGLP